MVVTGSPPARAFPERADSRLLKDQRSAGESSAGAVGSSGRGGCGPGRGARGAAALRAASGSPPGPPAQRSASGRCFQPRLCSCRERGGASQPHLPLPPRLPVLGSLALCRQKPLLVCVSLFLSRCLLLLFLLGIQHFEHGLHAGHESRSRVAMATSWALRAGELRALRTRTSGCQGRREGKGPEHGHAPVERPSGQPRARLQGDVLGATLASDTRCHVWRSRDHRQVQ